MAQRPKPDYAARAGRLKEVTDRLEAGITDLYQSDRYAAYLNAMSKFHRYSFGNVLLILLQCPGASQVAGFHTWKRFGRTVKKGEHGIQILAPCPYKTREEREKTDPATQRPVMDPNGQPVTEAVTVQRKGYKVEYVFDISQTEGRELPALVCELSGGVAQYEAVRTALEELSPVPVCYKPLPTGAKGSFSHVEQRISVQPDMSQAQTVKTLIHEIAHAKLHALPVENGVVTGLPENDRSTREVEAESVAYVVCQHFGIDTSDYTFGYVAGWSKGRELPELRASLDIIRTAAAEIIGSIETKCPELAPPEPAQEEKAPEQRRPPRKRRAAPAR